MTLEFYAFSRPESYFFSLGVNFLHFFFSLSGGLMATLAKLSSAIMMIYIVVRVGFQHRYDGLAKAGVSLAILSGLMLRIPVVVNEQRLESVEEPNIFAAVKGVQTKTVPVLFALPAAVINGLMGTLTVTADKGVQEFFKDEKAGTARRNLRLAASQVTDPDLKENLEAWVEQCFDESVSENVLRASVKDREEVIDEMLFAKPYEAAVDSVGAPWPRRCGEAKKRLTQELRAWAQKLGYSAAEENEAIVGAIHSVADETIAGGMGLESLGSQMGTFVLSVAGEIAAGIVHLLDMFFTSTFFMIGHAVMLLLVVASFAPIGVLSVLPMGYHFLAHYALVFLWVSTWPFFYLFLHQLDRIVAVMKDDALVHIKDPMLSGLWQSSHWMMGYSPVTDVDVLVGVAAIVGALGTLSMAFYSWKIIGMVLGRFRP